MSQLHVVGAKPPAFSISAVRPPSGRYESIDALRGLIMMVMAIDHASGLIARQHASEFWSGAMSAYTSLFPFLTRWITHLCAPGFFFLMGAGVYWYTASRSDSGENHSAAMRRIVWRGVLIFLLAQVFEAPLIFVQSMLQPAAVSLNQISAPPPNDGSSLYWGFIVLAGLGMVLMVCGLLLRLRPWTWLLVSALCVIATNSLLPSSGAPGPLWMAILLAPGLSQHFIVLYPLVPWLAGAAAGMYFGYWWRNDPAKASRYVWVLGVILLVAGLCVRAAGGWGNLRLPRDNSWIEFFNNVKYPPSLVYWLVALGVNLLLLALLSRLPAAMKSPRSPWIVFGQTPLFFYFAHFALLTALAFAFFREPSSLEFAWVMWLVLLIILYPVCLWYRNFKLAKPKESFWRLL